MKQIVLYPLKQPAIIVKADTGHIYTNQTAGLACHHSRQEGFLVLLRPPHKEVTIFNPCRWYDEMPALNDALYDEIEAFLNREDAYPWHIHDVRVDREARNEEAWIHITFQGDFREGIPCGGTFTNDLNRDPEYDGFPRYEGILTWENCD